ncbi:DNA internalization-related competence protein ComEC/Rec2 [Curtanaerobium respiraculi]|uniref:DNA internalization-related competence protein ComEC/Rec2 n=1 Tax=Curtanaerobium respiraculi TaxID=2949669 RepID=UPI0024B367BA|nr:DNA internalization-related competence protein ComEC/Rec2 [Curtanaerobium respiraculi]
MTLPMALGLWLACAAVLPGLAEVGDGSCLAIGAAGLACAGMAWLGCSRSTHPLPWAALLGVGLGVCLACQAAVSLHARSREALDLAADGRAYRVVSDAAEGDFGSSCLAECELPSGKRALVRINLPEDASLSCWTVFEARCRVKGPSARAAGYYWRQGAVGSATVHSLQIIDSDSPLASIGRFRAACGALFDGRESDGVALMKALLFGDRRRLFTRPLYGELKAVGLAHLAAVSGAHLALIAGMAALLLRAMRVPRPASAIALSGFITVYVLFTGASHSAIRAALMAVCGLSAFFVKRRPSALSALSLCAIALIAANPFIALSASFALSASATLGIVVFARYAGAWVRAMCKGRFRPVADAFGLTLAANACTAGISIPLFSQLPLISLVSNLLVAPLFAIMCGGGSLCVAASLIAPCCSNLAIGCAIAAGEAACSIVHALAHVPCGCIPASADLAMGVLATVVGATAVWRWWPTPRCADGWGAFSALAAIALAGLFVLPDVHGCEIVMLDVGQGDALLIRSGRHAMLVDTGTNDSLLLAGLARHDARALDAVLITHADDDHCGSLPALLDAVPTGCVCVAGDLLADDSESCARLRRNLPAGRVEALHAGDAIFWGGFSAEVLSPERFVDGGGNADSIVMAVACDCDRDGSIDMRALFTGDAEADILHSVDGRSPIGPVDILKVPHHGSRAGVDVEMAESLRPRVALVSVGEGNGYGHPSSQVVDLLREEGAAVYRTDEQGDVVCALRPRGIRVTTQR